MRAYKVYASEEIGGTHLWGYARVVSLLDRFQFKKVADLKEEESFLLKEKLNLKKELVTLKNNYEGRKAINDNLKRIKLKPSGMDCLQGIKLDQHGSYQYLSHRTENGFTCLKDFFFQGFSGLSNSHNTIRSNTDSFWFMEKP
ncbi:hypothetical protein MKX01_015896 [Papaver californicum]|nr:hypothetical protein MKX01_015896 [Papaver californicum]